ncbi:hypothetical protein EGW08_018468, partial [Elysia chlorotica]
MTPGKFIVPDQTGEFTGEADKLRWFLLPSEASAIVNGKMIAHVNRDDCAYKPGDIPKHHALHFSDDEWWWIRYRNLIICLIFLLVLALIAGINILIWGSLVGEYPMSETSSNNSTEGFSNK